MCKERVGLNRRRFLKTAVQASACLALPQVIPAAALGKNGSVAPSERITLGAIGIGNRGRYVLGCFLREPDLRCVAVCDVRGDNRQRAKDMVDAQNGDKDCTPYIDAKTSTAKSLVRRTSPRACSSRISFAARPACSRLARNVAACPTSPMQSNWPGPASLVSFKQYTLTPAASGPR